MGNNLIDKGIKMFEADYKDVLANLICHDVKKKFNAYIDDHFNGSLANFINLFIASGTDLFRDIAEYIDAVSENLSGENYDLGLGNIYLDKNFRPRIELIYWMVYTDQFPLEDYSDEHQFHYLINCDVDGNFSIEPGNEFDSPLGEGVTSSKDFNAIRKLAIT
jgi:hypothetical protein